MYASLIGAGISVLSDLLQRNSTSASGNTPFTVASDQSGGTAVQGGSGQSFGADLNQLFVDLQAARSDTSSSTSSNTTSSTDASNTGTSPVAADLKTVFDDLKRSVGHHHHHDASPTAENSASSTSASTNPFQNLAASLVAYQRSQSLTTGAAAASTVA